MRFDTRCWLWKRDRWPDACQEKHACCRLRYWEARSSAGRAQVTSGTSCGVVCACWIGWTRKLLASRQVVRSWFCPRTCYAVTLLTARLVFHFLFPHLLLVSEASAASLCWIRRECSNLTMWRHILLRFCNRHLHDDHVSTHWYDPLSRKIQINNHIIQWPSLKAHYFIQPTFKSSHLNYQ